MSHSISELRRKVAYLLKHKNVDEAIYKVIDYMESMEDKNECPYLEE